MDTFIAADGNGDKLQISSEDGRLGFIVKGSRGAFKSYFALTPEQTTAFEEFILARKLSKITPESAAP